MTTRNNTPQKRHRQGRAVATVAIMATAAAGQGRERRGWRCGQRVTLAMRLLAFLGAVCGAVASVVAPARAATLDLALAYERMLQNDPQVRAARAAREVGRDAGNVARAALLPQASINYLRNRTRQTERATRDSGLPDVEDTFQGRRAGLTIEQTLFDYSAISAYRMGKTQVEYAGIQYRLQFQQAAIALIDAYLNALLARDSLELTRHQLRVYEDMLRGNERMLAAGEGTRVDLLETRAQASAARSALTADENTLSDRLRELSALLGGEPVMARDLPGIDLESTLPPPREDDLPALLEDALRQNPEVQVARLSVRYSDLAVEREKGQFMPRVSLYATREHIVSDTINNKDRDYKSNTLGVQVSIPLWNSGASYYATRQAYHRLEQSRHELERATRATVTLLEQYHRVCATSAARARALRQNVADSAELVAAMHKSVAGGERTNTDALQAERQAYQSRQDLLRLYVEWFQAHARTQFYAGRFSEDDVLLLNRHLVTGATKAAKTPATRSTPDDRQ
jgi:protease secretion system outer membrane protein